MLEVKSLQGTKVGGLRCQWCPDEEPGVNECLWCTWNSLMRAYNVQASLLRYRCVEGDDPWRARRDGSLVAKSWRGVNALLGEMLQAGERHEREQSTLGGPLDWRRC